MYIYYTYVNISHEAPDAYAWVMPTCQWVMAHKCMRHGEPMNKPWHTHVWGLFCNNNTKTKDSAGVAMYHGGVEGTDALSLGKRTCINRALLCVCTQKRPIYTFVCMQSGFFWVYVNRPLLQNHRLTKDGGGVEGREMPSCLLHTLNHTPHTHRALLQKETWLLIAAVSRLIMPLCSHTTGQQHSPRYRQATEEWGSHQSAARIRCHRLVGRGGGRRGGGGREDIWECARRHDGTNALQHMLQHTALHPATHAATHCQTLQHTTTHCSTQQHTAAHYSTLQHTTAHCNTLHHTALHCYTPQHSPTPCVTLQHTAKHSKRYRRFLDIHATKKNRGSHQDAAWI